MRGTHTRRGISPIHLAALAAYAPDYFRFMRALKRIESCQRARLKRYSRLPWLRGAIPASYESFRESVPITEYEDWEERILELKSKSRIRFEPTSGSTAKRKWIPYPPEFLREINAAASAWLFSLGLRHPGVLSGRHYWSLSWIPEEMRKDRETNDDSELFSPLKRLLMRKYFAVPTAVSRLPELRQTWLATAAYLAAARDLALFSVWSPTFAKEMVRTFIERRETLAQVLETGKWGALLPEGVKGLPAPRCRRAAAILKAWDGKNPQSLFRELWPRLSLVSAWDSSTSAQWAEELKTLFVQADFQGKGLWATEGVVTIPFREKKVLALTSHFYEFRCLTTGRILPSWELEAGQEVQPILTTGSGLTRYALSDRMRVSGFLESTPCLDFLGRLGGVDLVGEKMNQEVVRGLLRRLEERFPIRAITLFAGAPDPQGNRPAYRLLAEGDAARSETVRVELEKGLAEHHHYQLARELGQLGPAQADLREDALAEYFQIRRRLGSLEGEWKIESLLLWPNETARSERIGT